jgi:hypothetical protein
MAAAAVARHGARPRVLLGVAGSVAAVKGPSLALQLEAAGYDVRVVLTSRGEHFWKLTASYDAESWAAIGAAPGAHTQGLKPEFVKALKTVTTPGVQCILRDADEWDAYSTVKVDPVLHIEVRSLPPDPAKPQLTRSLDIPMTSVACESVLRWHSFAGGRTCWCWLQQAPIQLESLPTGCVMTCW